MRIGVIVAARTGSSRLPGKALLPLNDIPMIVFQLRRLRPSRLAACLVLATTTRAEDDALAAAVERDGFPVFRGAEEDVVARYVEAAAAFDLDYVARVTGDCPFVDARMLDMCLAACQEWGSFDLATTKGAFPVGIDVEIYDATVMERLHRGTALDALDREHLTKHLYDHADRYDVRQLRPPGTWRASNRHFTVDTRPDYDQAQAIVQALGSSDFTVEQMLEEVSVW